LKYPDFTPLDFCLWEWLKSEIYKEKINTRDELVVRIMNSAALIKQERQDDLRRATRTIAKRVEKCIEVDGGIFEQYSAASTGSQGEYMNLLPLASGGGRILL
jgi:hypothetical protein